MIENVEWNVILDFCFTSSLKTALALAVFQDYKILVMNNSRKTRMKLMLIKKPSSWWWFCYMSKRTILATAPIAKPTFSASSSWWWLCYMSKRAIWASACIPKSTFSAFCNWTDDDFVTCLNTPYGQVLVLPSRRLVRPAADDDFVICRNAPYGEVLVLPSRNLVRPAADDDFVICWNAPYAYIAKPTSSASCSWWWLCYKLMIGK